MLAHQAIIPLPEALQVHLTVQMAVVVVLVAILQLLPLIRRIHPLARPLPHPILLQLQAILLIVVVLLLNPAETQIRIRIMITLLRPNAALSRARVPLEHQRPEVLAVGQTR